jgi:hypothetical protein
MTFSHCTEFGDWDTELMRAYGMVSDGIILHWMVLGFTVKIVRWLTCNGDTLLLMLYKFLPAYHFTQSIGRILRFPFHKPKTNEHGSGAQAYFF